MSTPLGQRLDFRRLWQAATISSFGSMVTAVALPFTAILVLDAGPRELAGLAFASYLPGALISLVAGAWADRFRRRLLLITADLGRALIILWVPAAAYLGVLSLWQLYGVAFSVGVLSVVFDVTDNAYLPQIVEREDLVDANARLAAGSSVAEATAFAGGGWLVQLLTAPIALLVDALTFIVSAVLIGRIQAPDDPRNSEQPVESRSLRQDIAEGLSFIRSQKVLRLVVLSNALRSLTVGIFLTLYMLFCVETLKLEPGLLGMIFALGSISSLVGASLASRLAEKLGTVGALIRGYGIYAVAFTLIPLAPDGGWLGIALLAGHQLLGDGGETLYEVGEASTRQQLTPDDKLGRVNGTVAFLNGSALLVGALAAGELGEWLGLRAALFCSLAGIYAGVIVLLLVPTTEKSTSAYASTPACEEHPRPPKS